MAARSRGRAETRARGAELGVNCCAHVEERFQIDERDARRPNRNRPKAERNITQRIHAKTGAGWKHEVVECSMLNAVSQRLPSPDGVKALLAIPIHQWTIQQYCNRTTASGSCSIAVLQYCCIAVLFTEHCSLNIRIAFPYKYSPCARRLTTSPTMIRQEIRNEPP